MAKTTRTQAERRETTIRKILDAAIEALTEHGYTGTSTQLVATRAGVSAGGLFRHFPTRESLMVAVGEDVAAQLLATYRASVESVLEEDDPLPRALTLLRKTTRSRTNQVWLELVHACRTDAELKKALLPVGKRYAAEIQALARTLFPDLARATGDDFPLLVSTIVAIFDGENIHRILFPSPEIENQRIAALAAVARFLEARTSTHARVKTI